MTSFLKNQKVMVGQKTEQVFMQKQPSEGLFEKSAMRNFAEFTRINLCGSLFF